MRQSLVSTVLVTLPLMMLAACGGDDSGSGSSSGGVTTVSTVPGAPTLSSVTGGNGTAALSFTAPSSNGGSAITGYTASCTGGGSTKTAAGTASPISVTGLTNGTAYSCSVTATNSVGTSPASAALSVTPSATSSSVSTASVLCSYSQNTVNPTTGTTSTSTWSCTSTRRSLTANGIPDHAIGTFPNANNPNTMTTQTVNFSAALTPATASSNATTGLGYALNGVKFDPGTAGTCPTTTTATSQCSLADNSGSWNIEALGQSSFNFGVDSNNAHVQPGGSYHYHGMPEGILTASGVSSTSTKMLLIGWAPDGYPVYARYGRTTATDASSALKIIKGSYSIKTTPNSGRPSTALIPMGAFQQDYEYIAGSGDLDECNGRFDVTPEFPSGIYHYYATDTYPYLPRCWKGSIN